MSDELIMLALRVPQAAAGPLAELLENLDEPMALAVSQVEVDNGAAWRVEAIYDSPPDRTIIQNHLQPLALSLGLADLDLVIDAVPDKDWVVVSLELLAPVRAGRFVVHGRHDLARVVRGRYTLEIEASRAFGTGHHETTRGCLTAIHRLGSRISPRRIFDLGCGTAVLGMAASRIWNTPVWAGDLDPQAVDIARETVAINGMTKAVKFVVAPGFDHNEIRRQRRFDLVLANVLVNPLSALAAQMLRHIAPSGVVVLSGILNRQAPNLANRYRAFGFKKLFALRLGDWSTLVLQRMG